MPELIATLEAMQRKEERLQRFSAALAGVDLDEGAPEGDVVDGDMSMFGLSHTEEVG